jgi:hypothetical protein
MSSQLETNSGDQATEPRPRLDPRLQRLVEDAVIDEHAARAVAAALDLDAAAEPESFHRRRALIAELAGYVGAAFVVVALAIMLSTEWDTLGLFGQVGVPAAAAVATWASALVLSRSSLPPALQGDAGRRLVGAVASAAAVLSGLTFLVWASDGFADPAGPGTVLTASLLVWLLAMLGYRLAHSAVGQLVAAASAATAATAAATMTDLDEAAMAALVGGLLVLLGVGWVLAARAGLLHEPVLSDLIGGAGVVAGALTVTFAADSGTTQRWLGYGLMALAGTAALASYVRTRSWPAVLAGVVLLVVLVPAALSDATDGRLGEWGVMLVAGGTLLVTSVVLLRTSRP